MNTTSAVMPQTDNPQVVRALEEYTAALEAGRTPCREEILARYPEAAAVLPECFDALDFMRAAAPQLEAAEANAPSFGPAMPLGDYRIVREVGRGGMGVVYEAEQMSLGRRVALKVLPFAATMDPRQLQRFQNEARAAASLEHPHIVPVYGVGSDRGVHYYAMKFIEGQALDALVESLRQAREPTSQATPKPVWHVQSAAKGAEDVGAIDEDHALPCAPGAPHAGETLQEPRGQASTLPSPRQHRAYYHRIAELALQAADALEHGHQFGVIHRDIKPANLLVDTRGNMWVTDFGLAHIQSDARLTLTGDLVGTLRYMSPETALAKRVIVDHRTDIYSLGATLYELLTLQPAFLGQDRQELLRQIAFEEPVPPRRVNLAVPVELETIVAKAMEKNPADRYATAKEMADDLKRYLKDEPTLARRPSLWQRGRKWGRRHVAAVRATVSALLVVVLVLAGAVGWVVSDRAAQEAVRGAETEQAVNVELVRAEYFGAQARLKPSTKSSEADAVLAFWGQAEAAMASVDVALKTGTVDDPLQLRVLAMHKQIQQGRGEAERRRAQLERQEKLRRDLDEARMAESITLDHHFDYEGAMAKYAAAFAAYGLEMESDRTAELSRRIRAEEPAVREALIVALDVWAAAAAVAKTEWSAVELRALAGAADDDKWRQTYRAASSAKNGETLLKLSAEVRTLTLPPANLELLALSLETVPAGGRKEAIAVLRWAHSRHPTDFWIAFRLGRLLNSNVLFKNGGLIGSPVEIEEALGCFRVALALRPDAIRVYINIGYALQNKKQFDEAIAAYRKAIQINPKDANAHFSLGVGLYENKQLDEALASFHTAIALGTKAQWAYNYVGMIMNERKQYDKAIVAYSKAVDLDPGYVAAARNLANSLRLNNQLDESITVLRKVIGSNPKSASLYNALANALLQAKEYDEAIDAFRHGIEINPKSALLYNGLGVALKNKNRLDEAIDAYRMAIDIDPKFANAHYGLGLALQAHKQLDLAIAAYRTVIDIDPNHAKAYTNLGVALWDTKEYDEAIDAWHRAIDIDPKLAQPYNNLGMALAVKKQLDEAIAAYRKAIDLEPKMAKAYNNLGMALAAKNQLDEAIDAYHKAIEIDPKLVEALRNLGNAMVAKNRFQEAIAVYGKAIKINPKYAPALNQLAWLLATCADQKYRDTATALASAKKAVALDPKNANFWGTLGTVRYRNGEWLEAIDALDKALELRKTGNSFNFFALAMAHWQLDHKDQAREWYDKGVEWMEQHEPKGVNLLAFRAEAAQLLGLGMQTATGVSKDAAVPKK